jgi:iron complex outermembrane receptor protein
VKIKLILLLLFPFSFIAQIQGLVRDGSTKERLVGAKIELSSGEKVITDIDGKFIITAKSYPVELKASLFSYQPDSIIVYFDTVVEILLFTKSQEIATVVVSSSRRLQNVEEIPISMEVIKPSLIDNKGLANLEQVVDQSPGVYAMDGQVSIRGGGGYSYGAGSRVLVVWNGIPMISPDVGDAKWNSIPMEQASQIEILKGASSVLYGSGALNGIISLTEKEPTTSSEFKVKVQSGVYDNPRRASLKWWNKNPTFQLMDIYYGKMYRKFGFTVAANGYRDGGFRDGEHEARARLSGTIYYRPARFKRLKTGIGYNAQYQDVGVFILWQSDSLGYTPLGGGEGTPGTTLSFQKSIRVNVDPYVKFYDKKNNLHQIKTRYYLVTTGNLSDIYASSIASMYYADYQFQKIFSEKTNLIAGITNTNNVIKSSVFGDHISENAAIYTQMDHKIKRFDFTAGMRLEYFKQDTLRPDSEWKLKNQVIPVYPVFRAAIHYKLLKGTHLRASFGQGIRFPSVAERFVATSVGGVIIFPNATVTPEKGWAAELGFKQVVKIGEWKGLIDVAGFINEYDNMMEFTFGLYPPPGLTLNLTQPDDPGYILNWLGFQAQNAERARISGLEFSFNSQGSIKEVEIVSLLGYTYMNPISLNSNPAYQASFSDSGSTMLKYRFNHLAKADIQATWRKYSIGFSMRYNSYMKNIDAIFEDGIFGQQVLAGLKDYRAINNKGSLVFDVRASINITEQFKVNIIANNVLNSEYVSRPGDIQAPRNFIAQLQYQFN